MLHSQLQRLIATGRGTLPNCIIVDVAAVLRWVAENDPAADPWPMFIEAARRSSRSTLFFVGPTLVVCGAVPTNAASAAASRLQAAGISPLRSAQPLAGVLGTLPTPYAPLGVVTAGVEERPYELWMLAVGAESVLDVSTGKTWSAEETTTSFGRPDILPMLYAATTVGYDLRPIAAHTANPQSQDKIRQALESGLPCAQAGVTARVQRELASKAAEIDERAEQLRGENMLDPAACRRVRNWLGQPAATSAGAKPGTTYLAVTVEERGDVYRFTRLAILECGRSVEIQGHDACKEALNHLPRDRWFTPRALDLLATMHDAELSMPSCVVDPGLCAFVLDPDNPPDLGGLSWALHSLPTVVRAWMQDVQRTLPPPTGDLGALVELLPKVESDLTTKLTHAGQLRLIEDDIGRTLPVLARIERRGAWVGSADWPGVRANLHAEASRLLAFLGPFGGVDPIRADTVDVLHVLNGLVELVEHERTTRFEPKAVLERLAAIGCAEAVTVERLRSIGTAKGLTYWVERLESGARRLRGKHRPQTTGRWGMSDLPLHSLPKHSPEAWLLRAGLGPPPGFVLISADWNAFEGRLLAALSGDPVLLKATASADFHAFTAHVLGRGCDRERAKAGLYGIVYGQSSDSFWRFRPTLARGDAEWLFQSVEQAFVGALAFRKRAVRRFRRQRFVQTASGWRRSPDSHRQAFNTEIQALAADIFRWVLRELDSALVSSGAFIVHQAHDDVIVASPGDCLRQVAATMAQVMNADVNQRSGLLPQPVALTPKFRSGTTWADLI